MSQYHTTHIYRATTTGFLIFSGKLPDNSSERTVCAVSRIHKMLPVYATCVCKCVLREMFRFLCDDSSAAENQISSVVEERLLKILLCDDVDIVYVITLVFVYVYVRMVIQTVPGLMSFGQKWRDTSIKSLPKKDDMAISCTFPLLFAVEDLVHIIASRVPEGSAIPTNEWVRLKFCPKDPTTARALHHTGRFAIKFAMQTRQIKGSHDAVWFCQYHLRLLKHFAVRWKDSACMLSLDDKAIIPIRKPASPVSTTVRQRNRCLVPLYGAAVVAWNRWAFKSEIPNLPSDVHR